MRILTILSGIMMLLTGVFCFMNPGQTFLAFAFVVGLVMVINGVIHTLAYINGRGLHNKGDNNGWILTDALITLLLGILVLCNQLVADSAIPMVFGMWVLVSGILRIEAASRINKDKKRLNFRLTMLTGILTTLIGLFGFINPLVVWLTTTLLLGMFMFMQGINIIELGINMPHEKKAYVKIYKRNREAVKITPAHETPEKVAERLQEKEEVQTAEQI
ncbi:MAG: HdeD family acid-resistance protein [Anaerofustis stercorihominis]|nr:HdeD family acid-resistance protein [Anaerofustis stercorihominis]